MDSPKTIVIFGGAGFIGHHLLERLKQTTSSRLVSVDIKNPQYPIEGVEYIMGDVRNLQTLAIKGAVEKIYNLAAIHVTPGHAFHEYYETNVGGAVEICAFARRHDVKEITFTSSIAVYGPGEEQKDENSPPKPQSAYGWSKALAENIHQTWLAEAENRRLVITRPAVIFGPHENGNFTRMARLLRNGFFIYPGRQDTIKACFYIEDLLDALEAANKSGARSILLNACYPDRYTIKQIVTIFRLKYFKHAHELTIPYFLVRLIAVMLHPLSLFDLGIHPDRVHKLVRSTDIRPGWLLDHGLAKTNRLPDALEHWYKITGQFE